MGSEFCSFPSKRKCSIYIHNRFVEIFRCATLSYYSSSIRAIWLENLGADTKALSLIFGFHRLALSLIKG